MAVSTAPSKKSGGNTTKKTTTKKTSGGGGGGGSGIKKTNDLAVLKALKKLLNSGLAKQRRTLIGNIEKLYDTQDADLLKGYQDRAEQLSLARSDNQKSEAAASMQNLSNRARETNDALAQSASFGAGESDTARSQLMAVQNWAANQAEVNRSFADTQRSINTAVNDLNTDTRTGRINLATQMLTDKAQVWANYYNQRAEVAAQAANIWSNPYSKGYKKGKNFYNEIVKAGSSAWENPGVDASITNWEGPEQPVEQKLNSSQFGNVATVKQKKKPEGSTSGALKAWASDTEDTTNQLQGV